MKNRNFLNRLLCCFLVTGCLYTAAFGQQNKHPKIVNIVNFIRLLEPRDSAITQDILYQTVVKQVQLMQQYKLGGTFLLQYDALMDTRYQKLLKGLPKSDFEIGAWSEIPQPRVEKAGLVWRGRYPWDWHADVGFSTGYTPAEREKLADVYMEDFKTIFGYYPKSVGSWFIDAHTLNYPVRKIPYRCFQQLQRPVWHRWLHPLGRLLEPGILPQQDQLLHAGATCYQSNTGSYFPHAGQRPCAPV